MNQRGVARVDRALKMVEGGVEVSGLGVVHHELRSASARSNNPSLGINSRTRGRCLSIQRFASAMPS